MRVLSGYAAQISWGRCMKHLLAVLLSLTTIVSDSSCGHEGGGARIQRAIPDCVALPLRRAAAGQAIGLVLSGSTLQVVVEDDGSHEAAVVQCADTRIASVDHAKDLVDAALTERASLELVNDPNDHASSLEQWRSHFPTSHLIQPTPLQIAWVLRVVNDTMPETGIRKLLDDSQFRNNECNQVDGLGRWAPGVQQKQHYVNWGQSGFGFDVFMMMVQALMASVSTGTPSLMVPRRQCWHLTRHYAGKKPPGDTPMRFFSKEYKSPCAWQYAQGICEASDHSCIFLPTSPCRRPPLWDSSVWVPDGAEEELVSESRSKGRPLPLPQLLNRLGIARGNLFASPRSFRDINVFQWYKHRRGNRLEEPLEKAIVERLPATLRPPDGHSLCQGVSGKCNHRIRFALYQYATRPNWRFREAVRRQVDALMERSGLRDAGDRGECAVSLV